MQQLPGKGFLKSILFLQMPVQIVCLPLFLIVSSDIDDIPCTHSICYIYYYCYILCYLTVMCYLQYSLFRCHLAQQLVSGFPMQRYSLQKLHLKTVLRDIPRQIIKIIFKTKPPISDFFQPPTMSRYIHI